MKVTPRVTIAQSSYSETSEDNSESFKDLNDIKVEKKVTTDQKNDYSKISHGISINLGNVGMSNSCGSTQLPRIAEEKDSPTGSKGDDYSTKEVLSSDKSNPFSGKLTELENTVECNDRREKASKPDGQHSNTKSTETTVCKLENAARTESFSNLQTRSLQNVFVKQSQSSEKNSQAFSQKVSSQNNEKGSQQASFQKVSSQSNEKSSQSSSQKIALQNSEKCSQTSVKTPLQINEKGSQVALQKLSQGSEKSSSTEVTSKQKQFQGSEKTATSHKANEQKAIGKNTEVNIEGRKTSKKHKVDNSDGPSNASSSSFEVGGFGKDKKNN